MALELQVILNKRNMLEIKNKKKYYKSLTLTSMWILIGFTMVQLLNPSFFIGTILIAIIIEVIFLSEKFTQSVSVDSENVTVVYYHFISKKNLIISKTGSTCKISKKGSFRSPIYLVMDIIQNNKKIYQIDSRDGFDEDELIKLNRILNSSDVQAM